jgi:hypothetical protein
MQSEPIDLGGTGGDIPKFGDVLGAEENGILLP